MGLIVTKSKRAEKMTELSGREAVSFFKTADLWQCSEFLSFVSSSSCAFLDVWQVVVKPDSSGSCFLSPARNMSSEMWL